jgi:hypothetical protein
MAYGTPETVILTGKARKQDVASSMLKPGPFTCRLLRVVQRRALVVGCDCGLGCDELSKNPAAYLVG